MRALDAIPLKIIQEQELVIGALAWSEAQKVDGLRIVNQERAQVVLEDEPRRVTDRLVARYERLFGHTAQQVCRDAVAGILDTLSPTDIPMSLRQ
jgi:hypothetical protein